MTDSIDTGSLASGLQVKQETMDTPEASPTKGSETPTGQRPGAALQDDVADDDDDDFVDDTDDDDDMTKGTPTAMSLTVVWAIGTDTAPVMKIRNTIKTLIAPPRPCSIVT